MWNIVIYWYQLFEVGKRYVRESLFGTSWLYRNFVGNNIIKYTLYDFNV